MNLSKNVKVQVIAFNSETNISTGTVDFTGFDGVLFVGRTTANTTNVATMKVEQDSDKIAEVTGTATGANEILYLDIYRPLAAQKKDLVVTLTKGSATSIGDVFAILYNGRKAPVAWGKGALAISPVEIA